MGVKLNTASGGSVSIEPTNTASNYTLTVPAQTGTVVASDSSGNVNIDSNTLYVDATNDRVGIGTSSLGANNRLTVDGGRLIVANGPTGAGNTSSTKGVQTYFDATNNIGYIYSTQAGTANYRLSLNGNDIDFNQGAMRIDSSGNLLVGGTYFSTVGRLTMGNFGDGVGFGRVMWVSGSASGGNAWADYYYNSAGTNIGGIRLSSSATAYNTSSDYRLKENIVPMTGALAKVQALKPCTYTWKYTGEQGEGFIAHELAEVVPDAVTGEKDAVNEDGNPVYQGIDTSFLVATLTAAIQELNAKVDAQAAEIALLKGQA